MSPRSRSSIGAQLFAAGQLLIYKRRHELSFLLRPTSNMSSPYSSFNPSYSFVRPTQQYPPPPPSSGPWSVPTPRQPQSTPPYPPTADPRGPPPRASQQASIPVRYFTDITHAICSHYSFLVCGTSSGGLLPLDIADGRLTLYTER